MSRHFIKPRFIRNVKSLEDTESVVLLSPSHTDSEQSYSEAWLQNLLHTHPSLLPANAFEASFDEILPVARELPTPAGPIDNFFITPDGDLILAECKLWRNPEARRKVIAQIIDYAAALAEWDYEHLGDVVNQRNGTRFDNPLYEIVREHPEAPDEIIFIDNVAKNLRLGRFLLLIVGDGIREDLERLTSFLQQRANLQFTLGLLGIGIYRMPNDGGMLVIPDIILKTTLIERAVITIDNHRLKFAPPLKADKKSTRQTASRGEDLTEIKFFETLEQADLESAAWLKARLEEMRDLGMTWELKKSLLPRYALDGEYEINFGYFKPDGNFITHNATWFKNNEYLRPSGYRYIENLSALVTGSHIEKTTDSSWKIYVGDRILNIRDLIGKEADFLKVISEYIREAAHAYKAL